MAYLHFALHNRTRIIDSSLGVVISSTLRDSHVEIQGGVEIAFASRKATIIDDADRFSI